MINAVAGAARPVSAEPRDARLQKTAQEFEALFVEMVFKQMRSANNALSGEPKGFARSTYEGWQDQETARSIGQQGNFGLAEILYKQLQQQAAATGKV